MVTYLEPGTVSEEVKDVGAEASLSKRYAGTDRPETTGQNEFRG